MPCLVLCLLFVKNIKCVRLMYKLMSETKGDRPAKSQRGVISRIYTRQPNPAANAWEPPDFCSGSLLKLKTTSFIPDFGFKRAKTGGKQGKTGIKLVVSARIR